MQIRLGVRGDLNNLRDIEWASGHWYREYGMDAVADDEPVPVDVLARYAADGRAWVALDHGGHPSGPEVLYQLANPGLAHQFAALRTLDAYPDYLPLQTSPFIGRDRGMAKVQADLGAARVLTLTGLGGVGKTLLAVQMVAGLLPRFWEGSTEASSARGNNQRGPQF
jgi:hypothetical protein